MTQFFRGQRVRIVEGGDAEPWAAGKEATFLCYGEPSSAYRLDAEDDCVILVDGIPSGADDGAWGISSTLLAPLTDPSAERFIESIKKLGREPINDAPKVTK